MRPSAAVCLCLLLLPPSHVLAASEAISAPSGWLGLGITCEKDVETEESFLLIHGTAPVGPASNADLEAGDLILEATVRP